MQHSDFKIGLEFTTACGERRWRCTDVGTRVIVCISLEPAKILVSAGPNKDGSWTESIEISDESWHEGPPYAIVEHVMDEYDIRGCEPIT